MYAARALGCFCGALLAVLVLVVVGAGGALLWAHSDAGERRVVRWINQSLARRLDAGAIRIGDLDLAWGRLAVRDLRLDGAEHRDVVVIPRLVVDFELRSLLRRTVTVRDVWIEHPAVRLHAGPDGLDLPAFASTGPPPAPDAETTYLPDGWSLRVDRLRVRGADLAMPSRDLAAADLDLEARVAADHDRITVEDLLAIWRQHGPDLGPVQVAGAARVRRDDLEQVRAEIGVRGARARVSGAAHGLLGPREIELALQARLTASAASRRALAAAFGQRLPDTLADTPPLTISVDLGGSPASAAVASSVWWVDRPTPEIAGLGPPALTAAFDATFEAPWSTSFAVEVPDVVALAPLGLPVEAGAARATGRIAQDPGGGVAGNAVITGEALVASGVRVDAIAVPVAVTAPAEGPTAIHATADARGVRPTDGPPARIGRLVASADLSVGDSVQGRISARTGSLDLGRGPDRVPLRGGVDLAVTPGQVRGRTRWVDRRTADRWIGVAGRMDVDTGAVRLDELLVGTSRDGVWRNPEPVTLVVADGEVRDLHLALVGPRGHLRVVGARIGSTAVDLKADAAVAMAHLGEVAAPFASGPVPVLDGQLTARADVRLGEGTEPAVLAVVRGTGLQVGDRLTGADLELRTRVRQGRAEATASLRKAGAPAAALTAELALPLDARSAAVRCGGDGAVLVSLPATGWDALRDVLPALPPAPAAARIARVEAQAWAVGDPCDPSANLAVRVDPELPDGPAGVRFVATDDPATDRLEAGFVATGPRGADWAMARGAVGHPGLRAWAEAEDPADGIGDWTVDARILGIPASLGIEGAEGRIVGTATASGTGPRLARTEGLLAWVDAVVEALPLHAARLSWATEGDRLVARAGVAPSYVDGLEAEAEVGLAALHELGGDTPIAARIARGELPLALAEPVTGGAVVDASGVARLTGTVGGTFAAPDADLDLRVRNGALTVAETGVRYSKIEVDAGMEGRTLTVGRARMASRPRYGRFWVTEGEDIDLRLDGTVTLDDAGAVRPDLRVRFDRFWAVATDDALLRVSGGARVGGAVPDLRVTGHLEVDEGRFVLDRSLFVPATAVTLDDDIVFDGGPPEILRSDADAGPTVAESVDVDVRVDVDRPIDLQATVPLLDDAAVPLAGASDVQLDGAVEGRVGVRKADDEIDVRGRLETGGTVELFGARFDIEQGAIAFAGSDYTEPNLEFSLERETAGYGTVRARITGTPSDLRVEELSSDRYEDPSDVMALLLFGRPLSELGAGQSQAGAQVVQSALVNLAGAELEQAIGVELVDRVDYTPGAGLSLGWSIGTDGFLTITLHPTAEDDENRTEATVTWLLGRDTRAELQSGDAAVTSAWLQWERRF